MGAGVFHGRVRDGNGCSNSAMATRPPNQMRMVCGYRIWCLCVWLRTGARLGAVRGGVLSNTVRWFDVMEFYRVIRTARLKALLPFYLRPINVVVYHGP